MREEEFPRFCPNEADLREFAASFSRKLGVGDVLSLTGRLGAGKTHFTKGLVEGLGCRESVTSPTFALLQEYHGGEVPVYHFDLYRLESVEEVLDLGWDDYLEGDGIVVAEWGDKFPELFPENAIWLEIAEEGAGRVIRPTVPG